MWEEVVLIAVVFAFFAVDAVWALRAGPAGLAKRRRPPDRPAPRWWWTTILLHVVLVASYACGLWTWESVGLQTRLWEWSVGAGLFAYLLCATLLQPLIFMGNPAQPAAQIRQAWRLSARSVAAAWPRSQRGKVLCAGLGLVAVPARVIAFYGILVVSVSDVLGTVLAGSLLGGVMMVADAARFPRRQAIWLLLLYLAALGLLFAGPGLLAVLVCCLCGAIQGNRLGAHVEALRAYRRRTQAAVARGS